MEELIKEFKEKTMIMNGYLKYMTNNEYIEMRNWCLKHKIKSFYKSKRRCETFFDWKL